MSYPDLKPGVKALTLPHPDATPNYFYEVVLVMTAPYRLDDFCATARGLRRLDYLVCDIAHADGAPFVNPNFSVPMCYAASALLPLKPSDDAQKTTRGTITIFGKEVAGYVVDEAGIETP